MPKYLTKATAIVAGPDHTCTLTPGVLKEIVCCWGLNDYGGHVRLWCLGLESVTAGLVIDTGGLGHNPWRVNFDPQALTTDCVQYRPQDS